MRFSRSVFEASCEAVAGALRFEGPADAVLSAYFRSHPKLGQQERSTVAETVYAVLRRKRLLEHLIPAASIREAVLAGWAVLLGANLRELEDLASPSELRSLADAKRAAHSPLPLEVECEMPDWLMHRLRERFDEASLRELCEGLLRPAPLDLRVNLVKITRKEALARLSADGIAARPTPYSPVGLRIDGKPSINRHALFEQGALEVQDEGSQLLCYLVAPRRGEMVADFCAGAGGKTLALGMLMRSSGRLYAFDVSQARLGKLKPRLARSGLSNVHPQRLENEHDVRLGRLRGKMDRVLVDAPCSGLGTLRRNPDLKWRQTPQAVEEMALKQRSILASAARLVKPGGRLVYATCSLLAEENSRVVEDFLAAQPEWAIVPAGEALQQERIPLSMGHYLELWSHLHGTDGFFAAVLRRKG
ncbi:MAG: SAM-dependent methyltransferase [Betaproteobacteria bacterium RBG_16_64_9]|nr:MAG: SAM-dependent methyltransferase [Betaproteobacteria bacterium RBG_16_64_9]OGA19332.1 MAG: SAM-dependent methyltransferase [Betaproteobacteria bacterium RIFCSPLOWO2_02_FULL_65_24]